MQNNVDISTSEDALDIKYGLYDLGPEREAARCSVKYILTDMNAIRTDYIRLGFHLHEFYRLKYYEDFGYATMEEFCDVNLGMNKSAVSRCINVFLRFCYTQESMHMMYLYDRYKNFSYSQLCEMLPLPDDMICQIKPEMTIQQIRDFKKTVSKKRISKENVSQDVSPVAISQPTYLCVNDLCNLKGAALYSKIKGAGVIRSKRISVYDKNGKPVSGFINISVDLLLDGDSNTILRLDTDLQKE